MPALNSFAHSWLRSFTVGDEIFMVWVCACAAVTDKSAAAPIAKLRITFIVPPVIGLLALGFLIAPRTAADD